MALGSLQGPQRLSSETMHRERRWTSAGETPAGELDRSTGAPVYSATSRQNEKSRVLNLLRTLPYHAAIRLHRQFANNRNLRARCSSDPAR